MDDARPLETVQHGTELGGDEPPPRHPCPEDDSCADLGSLVLGRRPPPGFQGKGRRRGSVDRPLHDDKSSPSLISRYQQRGRNLFCKSIQVGNFSRGLPLSCGGRACINAFGARRGLHRRAGSKDSLFPPLPAPRVLPVPRPRPDSKGRPTYSWPWERKNEEWNNHILSTRARKRQARQRQMEAGGQHGVPWQHT